MRIQHTLNGDDHYDEHPSEELETKYRDVHSSHLQEFDEELSNRKEEVERLLRSLPAVSSTLKKSPRTPGRPVDHHDNSSPAPGAMALQRKWQGVLRMSADRSKKLQEVYQHLLEVRFLTRFDI